MKIEKGKLYYDTKTEQFFKAGATTELTERVVTDQISVRCRFQEDWDYVCRALGHNDDTGRLGMVTNARLIYLNKKNLIWDYESKYEESHIITTDQFKHFYPEDQKELSLPIVDNSNVDNIIEILKVKTQLDFSIEAIERELERLKELKQKINNILK